MYRCIVDAADWAKANIPENFPILYETIFSTFFFFKEYNVRVASRYFKGPELLVDYQMYDYRFVLSIHKRLLYSCPRPSQLYTGPWSLRESLTAQ